MNPKQKKSDFTIVRENTGPGRDPVFERYPENVGLVPAKLGHRGTYERFIA
jgi:hypothetical protein